LVLNKLECSGNIPGTKSFSTNVTPTTMTSENRKASTSKVKLGSSASTDSATRKGSSIKITPNKSKLSVKLSSSSSELEDLDVVTPKPPTTSVFKRTRSKVDGVSSLSYRDRASSESDSSESSCSSSSSGSSSSSVTSSRILGSSQDDDIDPMDSDDLDMTALDETLGPLYKKSFSSIQFPPPGSFTSSQLNEWLFYRLEEILRTKALKFRSIQNIKHFEPDTISQVLFF
jgi:hypothetical protein